MGKYKKFFLIIILLIVIFLIYYYLNIYNRKIGSLEKYSFYSNIHNAELMTLKEILRTDKISALKYIKSINTNNFNKNEVDFYNFYYAVLLNMKGENNKFINIINKSFKNNNVYDKINFSYLFLLNNIFFTNHIDKKYHVNFILNNKDILSETQKLMLMEIFNYTNNFKLNIKIKSFRFLLKYYNEKDYSIRTDIFNKINKHVFITNRILRSIYENPLLDMLLNIRNENLFNDFSSGYSVIYTGIKTEYYSYILILLIRGKLYHNNYKYYFSKNRFKQKIFFPREAFYAFINLEEQIIIKDNELFDYYLGMNYYYFYYWILWKNNIFINNYNKMKPFIQKHILKQQKIAPILEYIYNNKPINVKNLDKSMLNYYYYIKRDITKVKKNTLLYYLLKAGL